MIVLPSWVKEYSTAMAFDLVTLRAMSPVDSRLRRVRVSMRCETLPRLRRNSPCRCGLSLSENKILGVHLPIKIGDRCVMFIVPRLPRGLVSALTFRIASHVFLSPVATVPACQPTRDKRN